MTYVVTCATLRIIWTYTRRKIPDYVPAPPLRQLSTSTQLQWFFAETTSESRWHICGNTCNTNNDMNIQYMIIDFAILHFSYAYFNIARLQKRNPFWRPFFDRLIFVSNIKSTIWVLSTFSNRGRSLTTFNY